MSTVTPLALSTAIRLGAMLAPQAFGTFQAANGDTCVVGAAMNATHEAWPWKWSLEGVVRCQICTVSDDRPYALTPYHMMVHLNDSHRWTRERIADQVEIWEQERDKPVEQPVSELAHSAR